MHVPTMSRADLEIAILDDDMLYDTLEYKHESAEDYLISLSTEELRELLSEWVIENNETY